MDCISRFILHYHRTDISNLLDTEITEVLCGKTSKKFN